MKEVVIRLGKNGITENSLKEIEKNIEADNTVKIKMLKNLIAEKNREEVKQELLSFLPKNIEITKSIGNVFTLQKKK